MSLLKIEPTNDKEVLNRLSNAIFGHDFVASIGFLLYNGDKEIGLARLVVTQEVSKIEQIGITLQFRGRGLGDFFTRALLNTLSGVSKTITAYADSYFERFGFKMQNGVMQIESQNIVFPKKCGD